MNINRARRPFPNPKYCIIFRFFGYNCSSSKCPNLRSRSLNLVMAQESNLAAQQQKQQQKQHNYFGQFQTNQFNCLPLQSALATHVSAELLQFGICLIKAVLGYHHPASLNNNYAHQIPLKVFQNSQATMYVAYIQKNSEKTLPCSGVFEMSKSVNLFAQHLLSMTTDWTIVDFSAFLVESLPITVEGLMPTKSQIGSRFRNHLFVKNIVFFQKF